MQHLEIKNLQSLDTYGNTGFYEITGKTAPLKREGYSLAKAEMPANESMKRHYHKTSEEVFIVTKGKGIAVINDEEILISEGSIVVVEPGDLHYIKTEVDQSLEWYAFSFPAFEGEDYIPKP